jgi:aspartyl-tRNA(Asn)/glutamyl-tRNA(Gln) amidotransferase subunit B
MTAPEVSSNPGESPHEGATSAHAAISVETVDSGQVVYEPVIGLEIHVQLKTRTKMFCGCGLSFGDPPNTHTCPVCLGLPGSLPVANAKAVHFGLMIGLALESELAPRSIFHRKNYFYPDLPKGYQISQYDEPLCKGGRLGDVRIHRVHLEEDAAKLTHVGASGRIQGSEESIVDFNRGGTPLAEIVTEPDLNAPEQAGEWLRLLRMTLRQLGVSDVNMEEGSLRCDANISLRPAGASELGTKTELKNMNSFRFIERGIRAEVARQEKTLRAGEKIMQETLHFDPVSGAITTLRSKEEAHDYRYFPEPDLVPVAIDQAMLDTAAGAMSELPAARAERLEKTLSLTAESAQQLAFRTELGDYFEAALAASVDPAPPAQALANWISSDLISRLEDGAGMDEGADRRAGDGTVGDAEGGADGAGGDPISSRVTPAAMAALVGMTAAKLISVGAARQVLDRLVADGGDPRAIVEAEGLAAIGGSEDLDGIVAAALVANADAAERVRGGNAKAIGPIVGYVMRETKGRADGGEVTRLVNEQLGI